MGNLIRPRLKHLVNTKSQLIRIGEYEDDVMGRNILLVKDKGLEIPGDTIAGASAIPSFLTVKKNTASSGTKGAYVVEVKPKYPDETKDYEWGVKVMREVKHNGFPEEEIEKMEYYSEVISNLGGAASGYLSVADRNLLVAGIVDRVKDDSLAKVFSGKASKVTTTADGDTIVINGTNVVDAGAGDAAANAATFIATVNATSVAVAYAGSEDDEVWIVQKETNGAVTGTNWTVAGGSVSSGDIYLGVVAEDADDKMRVFTEEMNNITTLATPEWPYLTWEDVAREFPVQAHDHGTVPTTAIKGATYAKYTFDWVMDTPGLTGASGIESRKNGIDIYVLASLVDDDIYDTSDYNDESGDTEDANFDDMLAEWSGVVVSSW